MQFALGLQIRLKIRKQVLGLVKEDIFALFSNEALSTKHIEVLCSIGHQRDKNAPKDLTCKEKDEFRRRPKVQELIMCIKEATAKMPPNPNKGLAQFKEQQKLYTEKIFQCARSTYTVAANASYKIPKVNNLACTPAGFRTESSHLLSTIMHVANRVVVKMTRATIANGILKI
ncbi:hypothetical protein V500_05162, partial [Pseudogymnoascus sp. VKM F-4518 (FW-2643)]